MKNIEDIFNHDSKDSNFKNFEELIKNITKKRSEIESKSYNIFQTLKMESDETKLHSAFIADLLNPRGLHNNGEVFLNLFLKCICKRELKDPTDTNFTTTVEVEHTIGKVCIGEKENPDDSKGGRIDLLIKGRSFIIAIENKIYAEDQLHQILRYHNFLKEKNYSNKILLYLTLFGNNPSELSLGNQDISFFKDTNLMNISYESDIIPWLVECQNVCMFNSEDTINNDRNTRLMFSIIQYREIIERLLGSSIIKIIRSDKMGEFYRNTEFLRTIKILNQNFNSIYKEIIDKIVNDIIEKLHKQNVINMPNKKNDKSNYIKDIKIDDVFILRFKYTNKLSYGILSSNNDSLEIQKTLEMKLPQYTIKLIPGSDFLLKKETDITLHMGSPLCQDVDKVIEEIIEDCNKIIEGILEV